MQFYVILLFNNAIKLLYQFGQFVDFLVGFYIDNQVMYKQLYFFCNEHVLFALHEHSLILFW